MYFTLIRNIKQPCVCILNQFYVVNHSSTSRICTIQDNINAYIYVGIIKPFVISIFADFNMVYIFFLSLSLHFIIVYRNGLKTINQCERKLCSFNRININLPLIGDCT